MFYDQNWANFIPSFYPREAYEILLDPRYDVAYWNLHYRGRHIAYDPIADSATYARPYLPIVFYHFSGTSTTTSIATKSSPSQTPVSPYQTRYVMADFPQLNALFDDYRREEEGPREHTHARTYARTYTHAHARTHTHTYTRSA